MAYRISKRIKCQLCGKYFISLLSHLPSRHSVSAQEYCKMFSGAPIETEELKHRRSKKASEINTGRKLSKETKDKISHSLKNSSLVARGKKHSDSKGITGVYERRHHNSGTIR